MSEIFHGARVTTELVDQLGGAEAICWLGETGGAVFDTETVPRIAEAGTDRLVELRWA